MRKIRKIIALILTFALCLGMVACGTDDVGENTSSDVATVTEAEVSTATDVAKDTTEEKEATEDKTTEEKTTEKKTEEKETTEAETTQTSTTETPKTTEAPKTTQAPATEAPKTTQTPTTEAPKPYETGTSVVAATCESGGYTVHYMSDGSSYTTDNTAALGHSWEEYGHTEEVEVKTVVGELYRCHNCSTVYNPNKTDGCPNCGSGACTYVGKDYEYSTQVQYISDGYRCSRCGATK